MTTLHRSPSGRFARPARLLATGAALLLATSLIGCGAKGGSDASTKDAPTPKATTTTTKPVTDADLKAALPTAKDLGGDYRLAPESEDDSTDSSKDDTGDNAIAKACPDAAAFFEAQDGGGKDEVTAKFETDDGRSVETAISRDTSKFTKDNVDKFVTAIGSCTELSFTDDDGLTYKGELSAEKVDNIGDYGMKLTIDITLSGAKVPVEVPVKATGILWVRGNLGGSVLVSSGFDQSTLSAIPADLSLLVPLSQAIDGRMKPLAG